MARGKYNSLTDIVQENLASADPFYRGPHRGSDPPIRERVRPVDVRKTARDLGRIPHEAGPETERPRGDDVRRPRSEGGPEPSAPPERHG